MMPGFMPAAAPNPAMPNGTMNPQAPTTTMGGHSDSSDKVYSFVSIPGTTQKKRPRRRFDEIERLYHCNWPGCTKVCMGCVIGGG